MNKTIIININGTVFHIEEQAYEMLKEYMTEVKRHFFNSADSLEITTDIENRIAEMFTEILARENRQAIIDQDVEAVIAQMGSVKDFEYADDEGTAAFAQEPLYNMGINSRRLFRDPDDHLIGGVCAGIANYFDIKSVWVRLLFALAFLGAGAGFFVYILLWVIIPKAVSRADKMAMKGEPLDLQGFKRNFEAELNMVGGRLADIHHEARPLIYRTRDFVGDFFHHLRVFLGGAGKIIIKLLGLAIILACVAGIIALVVALVGTMAFGTKNFSLPDNFFNYPYINQVRVAVGILVLIPLTVIIVVVSSAIFNTTNVNRSAGFTLLIVWISALAIIAYHASQVLAEFRDSAGFTQTVNLKAVPNQTYYLQLNDVMFFTREDSARLDIKNKFKNLTLTDNDDDELSPRSVRISIEKSDVPYPVLVEEFTARGRTYEQALNHARNTRYVFTQQDSVLKFDTKLRRLKAGQWHNEEVKLTLRIPLKATVMVNDKVNEYISNYLDVGACFPRHRDHSRTEMAPFIMTTEGLQCKLDSAITAVPNEDNKNDNNDTEKEEVTTLDTVNETKIDTVYIDSTVTKAVPAKKTVIIRRLHKR
ncbi:PspC domain-containing protein [Mucilaginibacter sp. CSA2-8R]|uniref:PspC domain-containing protein n=1 Tax=Mucilaginibacter sp. CSA2-8R TaxID=3141542 RepID=UPI00315C6EB8